METVQEEENIFLSVVIPVYKAETILPELCSRMAKEFKKITGQCELVMVEDCGPDRSWEVILELAKKYDFVKGIKFSRNFGQHFAISAGLDYARGEWVVVMDCDLQDAPEEISNLLNFAISSDYDIVLAQRNERKDGACKRFSSKLYHKCFELMSGIKIDSSVGSFRIIRGKVVKAFCRMHESHRLFSGMIQWLGFKVGYIKVSHQKRLDGKSSYNIYKLLKLGFDGIFSFSNRPLYFSIIMGCCVSVIAVSIGLMYLIRHLFIAPVPVAGWTSLILLISFFSGIILVNIGIVGIYIGRVYDQVKERPLYVIDETIMF